MGDQDNSRSVQHPQIPCWIGGRAWTAPGEPVSKTVVYDTDHDEQPFRIVHSRDQIREGQDLVQDYNFIDYYFGDPENPIHARHYLRDDHVSVDLPVGSQPLTLMQAREALPSKVLCYLQKRFSSVEVLVEDGYKTLWALPK